MQPKAEILAEFKYASDDPLGYVQGLKSAGRRVIGFFCTYAPEEIIHAAGLHPMRLFGTAANICLADGHLQSYCCSLVRGALEDGLAGRLAFLDGVVFPHTCDSIQRLSDIWRINLQRNGFFADVVMPVNLSSIPAREYLFDILQKFRQDLGVWCGKPISDTELAASIKLYNQIRTGLGRLDALRSMHPGLLSGSEMHAIVRGSMVMERHRVLERLQTLLAQVDLDDACTPSRAKRLIISGSICNEPRIFKLVEDCGGVLVWDDLCTGTRYYDGLVDERREPVAAMADRYIQRQPCPAKYRTPDCRIEHLKAMVRKHAVAGVVFLLLKFCDPHAFDYPDMKVSLEKYGIPVLLLEIEDRLPSDGQLATRLETFLQMI